MCDERITQGDGDDKYSLDRAKELCNDLAINFDTIRCKYWEYMASNIQKKAEGGAEAAGPSGE